MKTSVKQIFGNWDLGYSLDKHSISSVPNGTNAYGHMTFDTVRTEVGESVYKLKYRSDWEQVELLAAELAATVYPRFHDVGLVIPMVASTTRSRQPVDEVARALGKIVGRPCFENLMIKTPNGKSLKDLNSKQEKIQALQGTLSLNEGITNNGTWNALLVDDLYHTGASLEAACATLRTYRKIAKIYVATLTWR
jgi:predicted amidophosphoribosyltransferase